MPYLTSGEQYDRRAALMLRFGPNFPEHVIVRHLAASYIKGDIITLEEALCQMIRALCTTADEYQSQLYQMLQQAPRTYEYRRIDEQHKP